MPIVKLSNKKKSADNEKVVAGIRLTKSNYADLNTRKIPLAYLKEEASLAKDAETPLNVPEILTSDIESDSHSELTPAPEEIPEIVTASKDEIELATTEETSVALEEEGADNLEKSIEDRSEKTAEQDRPTEEVVEKLKPPTPETFPEAELADDEEETLSLPDASNLKQLLAPESSSQDKPDNKVEKTEIPDAPAEEKKFIAPEKLATDKPEKTDELDKSTEETAEKTEIPTPETFPEAKPADDTDKTTPEEIDKTLSNDFQEPTIQLSANERASLIRELSRKQQKSDISESLFCFFKIAGSWHKKHYLPTEHGIRIGGADSLNEISFNDSDLDKNQVVIIKIVDKWVIMDIGKKDMMRVNGSPSRQVILTRDMPFVLQIGSEFVVVFLSSQKESTLELIPADEKTSTEPDASQISKLKFGDREFPLSISEKLPEEESKEVSDLELPGFELIPIHDPEKILKSIQIPASSPAMHLGRSPNVSDLLVLDKNISRRHAIITIQNKTLFIQDCDTSNGTYLNSEEITEETEVKAGDIVTFGNIPFIVCYL